MIVARSLLTLGVLTGLALADEQAKDGSYNFLGIGDWGNDSGGQKAAAAGMGVVAEEINAQFVVALGDNFYGSGIHTPKDGLDGQIRFKKTFEDVYTADSLQIPFYAIAGNHDHGGNVSAQIAYGNNERGSGRWVYPDWYYGKNWTVPVDLTGKKTAKLEILFFDSVIGLGNSDIVGDDGNVVELRGDELRGPEDPVSAEAQWEWLEGRMNSSTADYLWVGAHYPVWSIASHGPTSGLVKKLRPLLHKYEANFFNGHDHDLEHIMEVGSKVNYVTTGSGMSCCYGDNNLHKVPKGSVRFAMVGGGGSEWEKMPFAMQSGFTSYTIGPTHMTVQFHAHNGTQLYQTQPILPRTGKPQPPLPPLPGPPPPAPKPPPPPPAPTPAGMQWECHPNMGSAGLKGVKDSDLTAPPFGTASATVETCQSACNGRPGCTVVNWHNGDKHCHVLVGTVTHADYLQSLRKRGSSTSCMLVKK